MRRTRFESLPPADPYRIGTLQVYDSDTAANFNCLIDEAMATKATKAWLSLTFHIIKTPTTAQTMYTPTDFATVIDCLNT